MLENAEFSDIFTICYIFSCCVLLLWDERDGKGTEKLPNLKILPEPCRAEGTADRKGGKGWGREWQDGCGRGEGGDWRTSKGRMIE